MKINIPGACALVGGFALFSGAAGATELVQNGSFTSSFGGTTNSDLKGGTYTTGGAGDGYWVVVGSGQVGLWTPDPTNTYYWSSLASPTFAYTNVNSLIYQDLGVVQADHKYTLTVDVGTYYQPTGAPEAALFVGGYTGTAAAVATGPELTSGAFTAWSASFTATPDMVGQDLAVDLFANTAAQGDFANVSVVSSAVPEPVTWTMMLVGVFGIGGAIRTNRRKVALA